jgi:hypothetical protein
MVPPPSHEVYLVFFDWEINNFTPEGMQLIQLAANQYKSGGSVRLQGNVQVACRTCDAPRATRTSAYLAMVRI